MTLSIDTSINLIFSDSLSSKQAVSYIYSKIICVLRSKVKISKNLGYRSMVIFL